MPRDLKMTAKHIEFEQAVAARHAGVSERTIENNAKGIPRHVVRFQDDGLMRWPVAYEHGLLAWKKACAAK
eukprot:3875737-Prymnesium_polylepis.1